MGVVPLARDLPLLAAAGPDALILLPLPASFFPDDRKVCKLDFDIVHVIEWRPLGRKEGNEREDGHAESLTAVAVDGASERPLFDTAGRGSQ